LNFSRPGAQIICQYFNLIHLGKKGYREIMENALANARVLSNALESTGWYHCVSDIHRPVQSTLEAGAKAISGQGKTSADFVAGLPVVAFHLSDKFKKEHPRVKQVAVSNLLRAKQYIIPSKYPGRTESIQTLTISRLPASTERRQD
jgi:glutamate decarboxylase